MNRSLRRCTSRLLRALGGTLALAAVGATAASAQAPPPLTLTGGHADWGLKQSFRSYIKGPIAHGSFTASDGATVNADETFRFSFASGTYDLSKHAVTAQFDGTVRFVGHDSGAGPLLDLTIHDPKIVTSGRTGTLYLDARSKDLASGQFTDYDDVAFATLDLAASAVTPGNLQVSIAPIAAVLTADGAAAFAGFYAAGTLLDPAALTVTYGLPAPPPPQATTQQPDPEPETAPEQPVVQVAAARFTALARPWNRRRKAALTRLVCRVGTCTVDTPKRIAFEVDGKRHRAAVIAPKRLAQGERGTIRIQLGKRARNALGRATAELPFTVTSGDHTDNRTLRLTLRRSGVTVG
jgi:Htaa